MLFGEPLNLFLRSRIHTNNLVWRHDYEWVSSLGVKFFLTFSICFFPPNYLRFSLETKPEVYCTMSQVFVNVDWFQGKFLRLSSEILTMYKKSVSPANIKFPLVFEQKKSSRHLGDHMKQHQCIEACNLRRKNVKVNKLFWFLLIFEITFTSIHLK